MKRVLTLIAIPLFASCAAQSRPGGAELPAWKVLGVGNALCADYLYEVQHRRAAREIYAQWVLGYISAQNAEAPHIYAVLDTKSLYYTELTDPEDREPMDWLDAYCAEHPDAPFHAAVRRLADKEYWDMRRRQLEDQIEDIHERFERLQSD